MQRAFKGLQGQVDVIIDDGLHRMKPVSETFINLWPLLSPTGIYLLEDIHRDADLHDSGWHYPFHTPDLNILDSPVRNHVQRFSDTSAYEVLWAIYPPRSIAPKEITQPPSCG